MKISIFGAGSWGTAIAIALSDHGININLWSRNSNVVSSIANYRENRQYLPECKISSKVCSYNDITKYPIGKVAVLTIPTQQLRNVCLQLKENNLVNNNIIFIVCSKGIEFETFMLPSEIVSEIFPENEVLVLSGPSFAKEVAQHLPCSLILAGKKKEIANDIIKECSKENFRISYSNDVIGVQIGAALKNVIAIACGVVVGMNIGHNAVATVITRGIDEIKSLCIAKNGRINFETIIGLACLGDLVLTCTGSKSRNMSFGFSIGQGASVKQMLENSVVVEGAKTVKSLFELSKKLNVILPISQSIYELIYEEVNLKDTIRKIL